MEKINLVELLKDCPCGMELDCTMYDNVTLDCVTIENDYPIKISTKSGFSTRLTKYGQNVGIEDAKCVIFPKGKKTWEGFQRPFKNGDIVRYMDAIAIFKEWGDETLFRTYVATYLCCDPLIDVKVPFYGKSVRKEIRLATEKEKEKLFQTIKDNGYQWNSKTKTLEKLIKPKFKVGDKIKKGKKIATIVRIYKGFYDFIHDSGTGSFTIDLQDEWELVPDKFDFTTLKPFDKVLVRDSNFGRWKIQFFEKYDKTCKFPFICMGYNKYKQCIPYSGNEHLHDTTTPCSDYYLI